MALVKHSVLGVTILAVAEGMEAAGHDADALLGKHNLDREKMAVPMARAPYEESVAFMREANVVLDDPIFHMKVSALAPLGTYHVADYFTMFAPTLGIGFGTTLRNAYIINSAIDCVIEEGEHEIVVSMKRSTDDGPSLAFESETIFAAFALRTHWITAAKTPYTTLRLRQHPPGDVHEIEELLRCHVEVWDGAYDQFIVPRAAWDTPSAYANPTMHAIINKLLIKNSRRRHMAKGMLMRVEAAVMSQLGTGAGIEAVAGALYMSSRTLQRRLAALGVKFRKLVTTTRHRLAMEMLRDESISLLEVASRTGYTDVSAFGRAFRKVTGYTPSEFRDMQEREQLLLEQTVLLEQHGVDDWQDGEA